MTTPNRKDIETSDYLTRHTLLALLSDEENARVADVEGGALLADGDEYVDLAHPSRGVRRVHAGTNVPMNRVLPRYAVKEKTWSKICLRLGVAVSAAR
jgi:hypothetical protein